MEGTGEGSGLFCSLKLPYASTILSLIVAVYDCGQMGGSPTYSTQLFGEVCSAVENPFIEPLYKIPLML